MELGNLAKKKVMGFGNSFQPNLYVDAVINLIEIKVFYDLNELKKVINSLINLKAKIPLREYARILQIFTNFPRELKVLEECREILLKDFRDLVEDIFRKKDLKLVEQNNGLFLLFFRVVVLTGKFEQFRDMMPIIKMLFVYNFKFKVLQQNDLSVQMHLVQIMLEIKNQSIKDFEKIFENSSQIDFFEKSEISNSEQAYRKICSNIAKNKGRLVKVFDKKSKNITSNILSQFSVKDTMDENSVENIREFLIDFMFVDFYFPNFKEDVLNSGANLAGLEDKLPNSLILEIEGQSHYGSSSLNFDCKTWTKLEHLMLLGFDVSAVSKDDMYEISQEAHEMRFELLVRKLVENLVK